MFIDRRNVCGCSSDMCDSEYLLSSLFSLLSYLKILSLSLAWDISVSCWLREKLHKWQLKKLLNFVIILRVHKVLLRPPPLPLPRPAVTFHFINFFSPPPPSEENNLFLHVTLLRALIKKNSPWTFVIFHTIISVSFETGCLLLGSARALLVKLTIGRYKRMLKKLEDYKSSGLL